MEDVEAFKTFEGLDGEVIGPIPSDDGEAIEVIVPLTIGDDWELAPDLVDDVRDQASSGADGMQVEIAGPLAMVSESAEAFGDLDSNLLLAAVSVVIVILLLTYRSPIMWILPLVCAGVAVQVASGVIYLLARYADLTVNAQSQSILQLLVLAASVDYALLLVARYREELTRREDTHEAMRAALRGAAPAIVASAMTVVLALLTLLLARVGSSEALGPLAAAGVFLAMVFSLTLLPRRC
jgi:RND superfamily putative drug exporter